MRSRQDQRDALLQEASRLRTRLREAARRDVPEIRKTIHEVSVAAINDRLLRVGRELKNLDL